MKNTQEKYTSFILFLLDTPGNLLSIILVWFMAISGMIVSTNERQDFDPGFYEGTITFLALIMLMIWIRAYIIYKKNS